MLRFVFVFAALCLLALSTAGIASPSGKPDFFVSSNGNDAWSGKLPQPNRAKTDGPFATLTRAKTAARTLVQTENRAQWYITVQIAEGFYPLADPLVFSSADSGSPVTPIVFKAAPGAKPVFSGGTRITGWKVSAPGRWEVRLPEVAAGKWYFSQLYVNGERRYRPRLPKQGYYFIAGDVPPTPQSAGKGFDRFRFAAGEIRADWQNRDDIEVLPFQVWTMARFRIASIDEKERIVTFTGRTRGTAAYSSLPRGNRYLVENVKEALGTSGEWYLDRKTGVLTYLPRPGETPENTDIVAPRLDHLVEVNGASDISFDGLTFAHSGWNASPEGNNNGQAEVNIPATLRLKGAQRVTFKNSSVHNIGNYAVELAQGTQYCTLENCEFVDLGGGGIKIGETTNPVTDNEATGHNTIRDCLIAEGGRIHSASVGIWIGQSPYNTIEHNEIVDLYYTGISPGWTWGYKENRSHDNKILYNHIYKIGQGVLSDMGGIYTLGRSQGTVLDHNRIHDVSSYDYGGWGIYFDEGTTGVVATNNVVYNTKSAPFHQHYGTNNLVENNVLALGREAQLMRTRADNNSQPSPDVRNELSFIIRRNIIYYKDAPLLGSNWSGTNFKIDDNLYWAGGKPVTFANGASLADWQARGFDKESLVADPLFIAPERGDFSLRSGSPANKIGFQSIDIATAGRRNATPYSRSVAPAFPPPPPPQPIADTWEDEAVGTKPSGARIVVNEEPGTAGTIRVTAETANTGKQSLKITDAAGLKNHYNPHFYYKPNFKEGTLVGKFALRWEAGAIINHEWRDSAIPYKTGPALHIDAKGLLTAGGKELTTLPKGRWLTFEISCSLGSGQYDLTVRLPGRTPPFVYKNLPCVSGTAFQNLRWWGFVADGDGPGIFYLDDISLAPK